MIMPSPKGWEWPGLKPLHYNVIGADPAWHFQTYSELGMDRSPDYQTMSLDQIKDLRVADLAAPDCLLALWIIDTMMQDSLDVISDWGFEYKNTGFVWIKTYDEPQLIIERTRQIGRSFESNFPMGMGYWTRANPELCLFATRGSPARIDASVRKLIFSPRREHSRKPPEYRTGLKRLVKGPCCELFSRETVDGWDSWGNQVGLFDGETDD